MQRRVRLNKTLTGTGMDSRLVLGAEGYVETTTPVSNQSLRYVNVVFDCGLEATVALACLDVTDQLDQALSASSVGHLCEAIDKHEEFAWSHGEYNGFCTANRDAMDWGVTIQFMAMMPLTEFRLHVSIPLTAHTITTDIEELHAVRVVGVVSWYKRSGTGHDTVVQTVNGTVIDVRNSAKDPNIPKGGKGKLRSLLVQYVNAFNAWATDAKLSQAMVKVEAQRVGRIARIALDRAEQRIQQLREQIDVCDQVVRADDAEQLFAAHVRTIYRLPHQLQHRG